MSICQGLLENSFTAKFIRRKVRSPQDFSARQRRSPRATAIRRSVLPRPSIQEPPLSMLGLPSPKTRRGRNAQRRRAATPHSRRSPRRLIASAPTHIAADADQTSRAPRPGPTVRRPPQDFARRQTHAAAHRRIAVSRPASFSLSTPALAPRFVFSWYFDIEDSTIALSSRLHHNTIKQTSEH